MKLFGALLGLVLVGAGCTAAVSDQTPDVDPLSSFLPESALHLTEKPEVVFPIENYREGRTFKQFGEYILDRFTGYHVGDDVEIEDLDMEVPVVAIAEGIVERVSRVGGYGGLVVVNHFIGQPSIVRALYGHLDLGSVELEPGDFVQMGTFIGNLGNHESIETDGERKHLHFGIHPGGYESTLGYESRVENLDRWINPTTFFENHGLETTPPARMYDPETDLGGDIFQLTFEIPEGLEVEYIPQIEALNLFSVEGPSSKSLSARDRSQVLIRYFDAVNFQTLSTVDINATEDLVVGEGDYTARRYNIEKKPGVLDFAYQPSWRNNRHTVTDFRGEEGFTRYYVVAQNPELDDRVYEELLASVEIVN